MLKKSMARAAERQATREHTTSSNSKNGTKNRTLVPRHSLVSIPAEAPPIQRSNDTGIPTPVLEPMESALGVDLSSVRVHANSPEPRQVGAIAFAQGRDIHLAPGVYAPSSPQGQRVLAHELGHVVQQSEGRVRATREIGGLPVNDDPGLEREADTVAARATATGPRTESRPLRSLGSFREAVAQRLVGVEFETRNKLYERESGAGTEHLTPGEFELVGDGESVWEGGGSRVESDSGWAEFITDPLPFAKVVESLGNFEKLLVALKNGEQRVYESAESNTIKGHASRMSLKHWMEIPEKHYLYGRPQITFTADYTSMAARQRDLVEQVGAHSKTVAPGGYAHTTNKPGEFESLPLLEADDTSKRLLKTVLGPHLARHEILHQALAKLRDLADDATRELLRHMFDLAFATHKADATAYVKSGALFMQRVNPAHLREEAKSLDNAEVAAVIKVAWVGAVRAAIREEIRQRENHNTRHPERAVPVRKMKDGDPLIGDDYRAGLGIPGDSVSVTTIEAYFDKMVEGHDSIIAAIGAAEGLTSDFNPTDWAIGKYERSEEAPPGTNTVEMRGLLPGPYHLMRIDEFIKMFAKLDALQGLPEPADRAGKAPAAASKEPAASAEAAAAPPAGQ